MTDEELIAKMRGADPWTAPYFANEALSFAADRIEALMAVTVGVKPLVWKETYEKVPKSAWASHTGFGRWFIVIEFLGMNHAVYRLHEVDYPTLDAAKAAAQADYEQRILAALEPVAAPDPAAIREAALEEAAKVAERYTDCCQSCAGVGTQILALIAKGAAE